MNDRKLPFESFGDGFLAAQVHHQWGYAKRHGLDTRRVDSMFVVQLNAAVDCGMVDDAAGKRLVGVAAQVEVGPEAFRDLREIVFRRLDRGETSRAFDSIFAGGKPGLRQQCRRVAVLRGPAWMERLRHGSEHLA